MLSYRTNAHCLPPVLTGLVLVLGTFTLPAKARERATVVLRYPDGGPALLESGMKINVSHVNVNWKTHWAGGRYYIHWRYNYWDGFYPSYHGVTVKEVQFDESAARLWVNKARSDLQADIADQARQLGIELIMVDRERVSDRLDEQELETAGITESSGHPTGKRPRMLDIDANVYGDINIDVKLETGSKNTISRIAAGYSPCGWRWWGRVNTSPRQKIRRIITFVAKFELIDARTGEVCETHTASWQPIDTENPGTFFGSSKHRIDFDKPDEQLVLEFFEREIPNFIAKLIPIQREVTVAIESSSHDFCERGVKELQVGDYGAAVETFRAAIADHKDDHRACFGAGLAHEALGNLVAAEEYYEEAILRAGDKHVANYKESLDRVRKRRGEP